MKVKVGDLVRNLNSESGMTGVVVGWHEIFGVKNPVVQWADGRCGWIGTARVAVVP